MFKIIKYIQPTWYFNLSPKIDYGYFPDANAIKSFLPELKLDNNFNEETALSELSYRANKSGYINTENPKGIDWWNSSPEFIVEEYKFARKYYHVSRVTLAMIIRIFALHNPLKEFSAFVKSAKSIPSPTKETYRTPIPENYLDELPIEFNPHVTVIIPTLNRYSYLKDVIVDLENQDYKNFDVIIIDQSQPFRKEIYDETSLNIKVIQQKEKALWLARNRAITESKSEYLLLYDDDSRIANNWIQQHLKCIHQYKADISSGVSISKIENEVPENYRFFRWSDQLDTGNVMIKREVFKKIGLFDRQFEKQRMGDGEFGLRAYLEGFKNISNPLAKRLHLKVETGGLREMGLWDAFRPKNIWSPRPIPSVLYYTRKYFGRKAAIISLIINIPPSLISYRYKNNKKMRMISSLIAILFSPFILIQVIRSWNISTRMLEKSKIEILIDK